MKVPRLYSVLLALKAYGFDDGTNRGRSSRGTVFLPYTGVTAPGGAITSLVRRPYWYIMVGDR